ncbi:hypothetical protein ASG49_05435 [Marmoricola sp. Leaf446]|nr:hypothetical protein ASG49_05435 [Marmoricola sp. Leaf446]
MQELDSRADTLRHRLGSIPEARQLQELGVRRKEVDDAARDLRIEVADLTAEQKRADADVEQVKARRTRDQGMVDGGGISDPKALERMLGELQSLERRITSLEDTEIEVMERLETAENALAEREAELAEIDARAAELKSALESSAGSLQHDLEQVEAERYAVALDVPDDLRALYEKLRANKGGTGAAALRRRECGGCRLTLNASDLAIIARKPADEVVRCEECDRILVRTEESGL